jgi:hypothetical protein
MTFDNIKTVISLRIKIFIVTVLLLTYFIVTYGASLIRFPLLGMNETFWTVLLVSIYFLYAIYPMVLNYQYVYYSDEGDTIVFRYFMAGIVGGKKNSIEINKHYFAGYKTETGYFGMKQSVTLYQRLREGVASYPPIYISNLSAKERAKVLNSLHLHSPKDVKEVTP